MAKLKFWMLGIFTISVLLVSCGEKVDESQVLVDYLESAASPIDVAAIPKYILATAVQSEILTGTPYIMDIRGASDFAAGHIKGAVNVVETDVISTLGGLTIADYSMLVVVCKTGQTAAYTASLARLAGYDVGSMKWGMCAWNEATAGPLNGASLNTYALDLETVANDKAAEGALPVLSTDMETGAEILDSQLADVAAAGFAAGSITAAAVWDNPGDYYIVNYWKVDHYNLGHITGATQYAPDVDLFSDVALKTLPADKTIVVYCYTGQTSAFLCAYLRVLGYDAKSLKFGMNGMAHDWATDNELTHWDVKYIIGGVLAQ